MKQKKSAGELAFDILNYFFLFLLAVCTLYPLLYCLYASISDPFQMIRHTGLLFYPLGFSLGSYELVFRNPMILTGYGNTLFYLVAGTVLNLALTSLGAYFLSRKRLMLRRPLSLLIIFTMFFSGGIVPQYLIVQSMGLIDSRASVLLPVAISTYNLIVMRTSFEQIPESIEESAKIDGAGDFLILVRIILPLSSAAIAVMILFYGAYHWNAWFSSLIYLRTRNLYPLQIILREVLIGNSTESMTGVTGTDIEPISATVKYATVMVATLPILVIYPFLQKHFVKGVMVGAVKG